MRRSAVLTVLLATAFVAAPAQSQNATPVLTLEEAVRLAIRNNPTYLQSASARARAGAALRTSYGQLLPSLSSNFSSSYREGKQEFFGGQAIGAAADLLSSSAGVSLNGQLNRATLLAPKVQRANLDAAEAELGSSEAQLRSNVITQYLNVLQAQARAAFADTLLQSLQAQLTLVQARQQVGAANSVDVRRSEVQVGQQRVALLQARNAVEVEKLRLFQQLGVDPIEGAQLTSQFAVEEPRLQLADVLNTAKRANPTLMAARSRERASDTQLTSARSAYFPTLSYRTGLDGIAQQLTNVDGEILSSQLRTESSRRSCLSSDSLRVGAGLPSIIGQCNSIVFTPADAQALRDQNSQFPFSMSRNPINFSVTLSLPIFDGFSREQRVQEATATRNDAKYRVRDQELRLNTDVTSAYRNMTTQYQTVRIQEQNSIAAREALALAQERYRVGASSFVELTQARSDFDRAETDRINAVYEFHKAFAALEAAVGRPLR